MMKFGEKIRQLREEKGMTQQEMAGNYTLPVRRSRDGNAGSGIPICSQPRRSRRFFR